jgi:hypothetical protein
MLGVVFTEFVDLVETRFSPEIVDTMIEKAGVTGAYTAVGNYPLKDMISMLTVLSSETGIPVPDLLRLFGERLFEAFANRYSAFLTDTTDAFTFISDVEERIHAEVRKLYPHAELPRFRVIDHGKDLLVMRYQSFKCLGDLAIGLIIGCGKHFKENLSVTASPAADGPDVVLTIVRH